MKICGIYGIRNVVNGKWYVGQSVDVDKREYNHFLELNHNRHFNIHLQRAFNKYGKDNFEFRILEKIEEGLLDIQERIWIKHYKSNSLKFGYNRDGGGNINKHCSVKTRQKMSESRSGAKNYLYGKHLSKKTRCKISNARKGFRVSKKTRKKMSRSHKGKPNGLLGFKHSERSRRKMSKAHKGIYHSQASIKKMSKISKNRKRNIEGEFIR